jgi:acetyl esterase/lipase
MKRPLPDIPPELRALVTEVGKRWTVNRSDNIALMIERFTALLRAFPTDGIAVRRDLAYGSHPRQQLDVYTPEGDPKGCAAVVFVHGGAFMDGHRNRTDRIYSNVPLYFARNGIVGINIGYRLGRDVGYPGATEDVASAVAWTREHAAELGVDRDRIFLMGHSAGAAHAGSYAYDKRLQPADGPGIAGFIVVSGRVRADNRPENPNADKVVSYYGTSDAARLDDVSPVSHVGPDSVPTFVAWGEYENPLLDMHCAELVFRLAQAKKRSPPVFWLAGHNHTSTIGHIGTSDEALGQAILQFIADPA